MKICFNRFVLMDPYYFTLSTYMILKVRMLSKVDVNIKIILVNDIQDYMSYVSKLYNQLFCGKYRIAAFLRNF